MIGLKRADNWRMSAELGSALRMLESAEDFIARKDAEWAREAWTLMPQSNYPAAVVTIERLRREVICGDPAVEDLKIRGVEYRLGYYIIGRNGRASGRWVWGQFAPMMPGSDLHALLEKAKQEGTLRHPDPVATRPA